MKRKVDFQLCTTKDMTIDDRLYPNITSARKAAKRLLKKNEHWCTPGPIVIWKMERVDEVSIEDC